MNFENEVLNIAGLPKYENVSLTAIDIRYRKVILWNWIFTTVFLCGGGVAVTFINELVPFRWLIITSVTVLMVFWLVLWLKSFERRSYAVRSHDLLYRYGILSIITTVIPFNRIQHVAVKEGIISRFYGLASIQVFTAGGASADLKVKGLDKETAEHLREIILEKIRK